MNSYQEGAFNYAYSKGTIPTDYQRNGLKSIGDIYTLLKGNFKNIIQGLLKVECNKYEFLS